MTEEGYPDSDWYLDLDKTRLGMLEETWDPVTIRRLELLGVGSGWECLEVGAGLGSMSLWLADRVGPSGKVVATDISPELHRPVGGRVEVRRHDIMTDGLERDRYDLVHCRALLQHIVEPEKALEKMAAAVKPGGWLLIEELDNPSQRAADPQSESGKTFELFQRTMMEFQRSMGIVEPVLATQVAGLVEGLGFVETRSEGVCLVVRGDDPWARYGLTTLRAGWSFFEGTLTDDARELIELKKEYESLLEDPTFSFISGTLFGAWGRKAFSK